MQWNLRSPAKAPVIFLGLLRLKRGQRKRKHSRKDCQKMTDSKVYACSDSDLSEVLYHHVIIETKKIGIFRIRLTGFCRWNFLRFAEALNMLVAFLVPVEKKNHRTKFEIEEKNTKLKIGRKLLLWPLFFRLINDQQDNLHKTVKILRDLTEANWRKSKAKPNYSWRAPPFVEP